MQEDKQHVELVGYGNDALSAATPIGEGPSVCASDAAQPAFAPGVTIGPIKDLNPNPEKYRRNEI
jgi:hypothetical protein